MENKLKHALLKLVSTAYSSEHRKCPDLQVFSLAILAQGDRKILWLSVQGESNEYLRVRRFIERRLKNIVQNYYNISFCNETNYCNIGEFTKGETICGCYVHEVILNY